MRQSAIQFEEMPDDPVRKAEQDTLWWLVNRIRTRAEAEEALRIAAGCIGAVADDHGAKELKLRAALGAVRQAVATWEEPGDTEADRLQLWERLEAQLARRARETLRADRAACYHYGRLLLAALREAYALQKHGNLAVARWAGRRE